MSEGSKPQPKKKSGAEDSSTKRTNCDADLDQMNLSPMVRHLVENMTEEHWRVVREALCGPGTREEVCSLCASIVKNVVQTARYYLIPALNKIGVPVPYMIVCGVTKSGNYPCRVSEAKNAGESSLAKGTQELAPGVVVTEQAETSGHSASGPVLHQFSSAAFQERAAKKVSEVLLQTLQSDSCPESPAGENVGDDSEPNTEAVGLTDLSDAFFPSGQLSQSVADDLVGDVIDGVKERVSDQELHSTTYHVVACVTGGIKDLLVTRPTFCMKRIYTVAQRMFNSIQNTVGNLVTKSVRSGGREEFTVASAKSLISQVILTMLSEPDPHMAESSEQVELINKILNAVLEEVQMIEIGREERPDSEDDDQVKHHGDPPPTEVFVERISPVLTHTFVDMDACSVSPVCANATISCVLDTILGSGKLGHNTGGLICESKILEYSCDIASQVQKILRGYHSFQTICVPIGKSLSDSILCKLPPKPERKNEVASGFIYNYVEEAVKRLVLSCLFPPAAFENQGQLRSSDMSKSAADVLEGTVNLFTQMLTKDALMTLSTEVKGKATDSDTDDLKEPAKEDQKLLVSDIKTRQSAAGPGLAPCVSGACEDQCGGVTLSTYLLLPESKSNYASLVSMLVIRLLKKFNHLQQDIGTNHDGLSDNMLDLSRVIIQKILSELHTAFGIAHSDNYPQQMNVHQMYQNVYKDLVQELGSESMLRSALDSQDPSLESTLIEKLTKEIAMSFGQTSTSASSDILPIPAGITFLEKNKATSRNKTFPFRMPTFKLKKSKRGSQESHVTACQTSPDTMTSSPKVLVNKTSPELSKTGPQLTVTLAGISEAQALAGPLEMPEEAATVGCCFFRMPKLRFSFKKMMKRAKVGHSNNFRSCKDNSTVPASCETLLMAPETPATLGESSALDMGLSLPVV